MHYGEERMLPTEHKEVESPYDETTNRSPPSKKITHTHVKDPAVHAAVRWIVEIPE